MNMSESNGFTRDEFNDFLDAVFDRVEDLLAAYGSASRVDRGKRIPVPLSLLPEEVSAWRRMVDQAVAELPGPKLSAPPPLPQAEIALLQAKADREVSDELKRHDPERYKKALAQFRKRRCTRIKGKGKTNPATPAPALGKGPARRRLDELMAEHDKAIAAYRTALDQHEQQGRKLLHKHLARYGASYVVDAHHFNRRLVEAIDDAVQILDKYGAAVGDAGEVANVRFALRQMRARVDHTPYFSWRLHHIPTRDQEEPNLPLIPEAQRDEAERCWKQWINAADKWDAAERTVREFRFRGSASPPKPSGKTEESPSNWTPLRRKRFFQDALRIYYRAWGQWLLNNAAAVKPSKKTAQRISVDLSALAPNQRVQIAQALELEMKSAATAQAETATNKANPGG
jgi:hypothetical protein